MAYLTKNILVTMPVEERHKDYLEKKAAEGKFHCCFQYASGAELTDGMLEEAHVILGNLPAERLKSAKNLEWLQLNSAGADAYVKPGVMPEKAVLSNATGAYGLAVSEHMLALTFELIRRLHQYRDNQRNHQWEPMGNIISVEGSTVLVLGLGDIGGEYARKMKALGAYVIGVRRTCREKPDWLDEQYTLDALDHLLGRADIVAMVLPGGDATSHLMDERRLRLMKKGAFLINVGRGSAIEPSGLLKVLEEEHLGGCGLDVTEPEPLPAESPVWDGKNLVITPHVAGNFWLAETFERIVRIAGTNLEAWVRGGTLKNQVDFGTGYRKQEDSNPEK